MFRHCVVGMAALVLAGCGDEAERAGDATKTATATATPPVPRSTPDPPPSRARSARSCTELWNADALPPGSFQVSADEFLARVAPVRVRVTFERGDCFVVWPIGGRRIAYAVAADGRRPFGNPDQRRLESGERVPYNGRADREGRVALG